MEKFTRLKALIDGVSVDAVKFYQKGNSVAGTRLRKGMQELKCLAQEIRKDVSTKKNSKYVF